MTRRRRKQPEARPVAVTEPEPAESKTFWNGEPCQARRVRVLVGESERSSWWCARLVGTTREAVEVTYGGQAFYLDNEDGSGWRKVTNGKGSPQYGHKSLPVARVVEPLGAGRG